MDEKQNAFQINREDNVATALTPLVPGPVELRGDACAPEVEAATEVPMGHKLPCGTSGTVKISSSTA